MYGLSQTSQLNQDKFVESTRVMNNAFDIQREKVLLKNEKKK